MKFKTQYEKNNRYLSNSGDPDHILYTSRYNEDGIVELVEIGKENIPQMINSHAESVDINVIMERFAQGDREALNRRQLMFGDFTALPKTLAEALNIARAGEEYFDTLPVEEKKKFNNSYAEFLATFDKVRAAEAAAAKSEEVSSSDGEADEQA